MDTPILALIEPHTRIAPIVNAVIPDSVARRAVTIDEWVSCRELGVYWCALLDAALFRSPSASLRLADLGSLLRPADIIVVDRGWTASPVSGFGGYVPAMHAPERLWPVMTGAAARSMLSKLRRRIRAAGGLIDPMVIRALDAIVTAPEPFTHVLTLADHLRENEVVLRRKWKREIVYRGGPHLFETIDAVLLLRLAEQAEDARSARAIVRAWRMGPDRPRDIATRLVGSTWEDIRGADFPALLAWHHRRLLTRILTDAGGGGRQMHIARRVTGMQRALKSPAGKSAPPPVRVCRVPCRN